MDEARRQQAQAALEAASRVYEGTSARPVFVTETATRFLKWLEENS